MSTLSKQLKVWRPKVSGVDYTTNAPMVLARLKGIMPREAGALLLANLRSDPNVLALCESIEYWEPDVRR